MTASEAFEKSNTKMNSIGSLVNLVIEDIDTYINETEFTHAYQFVMKFTLQDFGVNEIQQNLTKAGLEELGYIVKYVPLSTQDPVSFWGYTVSWENVKVDA